MGSGDTDTFVQRLNDLAGGKARFLNFGVPGYSTDQEVLLIEREVFSFRPSNILLVVYLGNDLIDNEGPFPLAAVVGKPYFELGDAGLILRNSPVRDELKPAGERTLGLYQRIFGPDAKPTPRLPGCLGKSALLERLGFEPAAPDDLPRRFEERFAPTLELFAALVDRAQREAEQHQVALSLVLVAGSSFVESPNSISARYQDHLRRGILDRRAALGVEVIDLAAAMRARFDRDGTRLFNPHEQHLSVQGNDFAARFLWDHLSE